MRAWSNLVSCLTSRARTSCEPRRWLASLRCASGGCASLPPQAQHGARPARRGAPRPRAHAARTSLAHPQGSGPTLSTPARWHGHGPSLLSQVSPVPRATRPVVSAGCAGLSTARLSISASLSVRAHSRGIPIRAVRIVKYLLRYRCIIAL